MRRTDLMSTSQTNPDYYLLYFGSLMCELGQPSYDATGYNLC